jgi:hypothetical protein
MPPELLNAIRELTAAMQAQRNTLEGIQENTAPERGTTAALNKMAAVFSAPAVFGPQGATNALATQMGQYQQNFNQIQKSAIALGRDFESINSQGMVQALEDSYGATISMKAAVEAFDEGIGLQSKNTIELAAQMKATGQDSRAMLQTMRNSQVVGNITNAEMDSLASNLLTTSKQYGISSDNLVAAVNTLSTRMQDFGALGLGAEMQQVVTDLTAKYGAGSEKIVGSFLDKITRGENLANLQKLGIAEDVVKFGKEGGATADQLELIAAKASGAMQDLISQMESGVISRFQALRMAEDIYGEEGKLAILMAGLERQEVAALGATDATDQLDVQLDKLYDVFYNLSPIINAVSPTVNGLTLGYSTLRTVQQMVISSTDLVADALERMTISLAATPPEMRRFTRIFTGDIAAAFENLRTQAAMLRIATDPATARGFADLTSPGGYANLSQLTRQNLARTGRGEVALPSLVGRSSGGTVPARQSFNISEGGAREGLVFGEGTAVFNPQLMTAGLMASQNLAATTGVLSNTVRSFDDLVGNSAAGGNPTIAQSVGDMPGMKMVGLMGLMAASNSLLSTLGEGNTKVAEYMSTAVSLLTTLVTLQQASQMLGGLGGMKAMAARMLPAVLPFLAPLAPLAVAAVAVGGAVAIGNMVQKARAKEAYELAKIKEAKISTNEYMRATKATTQGLLGDTFRTTSRNESLEVARQQTNLLNIIANAANGTKRALNNANVATMPA